MIDLIVKEFKMMGIKKVAPTHCSGPKAEERFAKEYGEGFITVKVGGVIRL